MRWPDLIAAGVPWEQVLTVITAMLGSLGVVVAWRRLPSQRRLDDAQADSEIVRQAKEAAELSHRMLQQCERMLRECQARCAALQHRVQALEQLLRRSGLPVPAPEPEVIE